MKSTHINLLFVALASLFLQISFANAASITVLKIKQNKAIVTHSSDINLTENETYTITSERGSRFDIEVVKILKKRALVKVLNGDSLLKGRTYSFYKENSKEKHILRTATKLIGGSFYLSSKSNGGGGPKSTLVITEGLYGKKEIKRSYGGIGVLSFLTSGSYSAGYILGGGFYDYNLVDDIPENETIYSLRGVAAFGLPFGDGDNSFGLLLSPRFVMKWYGFSDNLALVGSFGYDYLKWFGGTTYTSTGIIMSLGFTALF